MAIGPSDRPAGYQFAFAMREGGPESVRAVGKLAGAEKLAEAFLNVHDNQGEMTPAFLHSALCSMSLPVMEPADPTAPIIRENGRYALMINPRPVMRNENGKRVMRTLGVPFGTYPRILLIYIMTEAVRYQNRDVYLGKNLTEWMRRLGFSGMSYGKTGNAPRLLNQFDRTLACEFQWRWDSNSTTEAAFAVRDIRVSDEYCGVGTSAANFERELRLSEAFFKELCDHAVPLNERAIAELKGNATALDLYTFLAHRLFRISGGRDVVMSWNQLAMHMGNESDGRSFRQRIRQVLEQVLAVYPAADVDFTGKSIILRASRPANEGQLFGRHLHLVGEEGKKGFQHTGRGQAQPALPKPEKQEARDESPTLALPEPEPVPAKKDNQKRLFPDGTLSFGKREERFRKIALEHGHPYDVDMIANEFRKWKDIGKPRTEDEWELRFKNFALSYASTRNFRGDEP